MSMASAIYAEYANKVVAEWVKALEAAYFENNKQKLYAIINEMKAHTFTE